MINVLMCVSMRGEPECPTIRIATSDVKARELILVDGVNLVVNMFNWQIFLNS